MDYKSALDSLEKLEFEKKAIVDGLFSANTHSEKYQALKLLADHQLIPIHSFLRIPKFMKSSVTEWMDRHETVTYTSLIDMYVENKAYEIESRGKHREVTNRYLNMLESYTTREVFNMAKELRVCGFKFDW